MKPGTRALGVAVSGGDRVACVAGAVVRRDRVTDGFAFADCTVGGTDATRAVQRVFRELDREDCQYLLASGVAPAWFNLLDLDAIHETVDVPVIAVSYEDSPGLSAAIEREFDGSAAADRLARYNRLPPRHPVRLGGGASNDDAGDGESSDGASGDESSSDDPDARTLYVRGVGCDRDRTAEIVRAYTPDGSGRPEPLRVARLAARAGRRYRD